MPCSLDRSSPENSSMSSHAERRPSWKDCTHESKREVGPMAHTVLLVGTRKGLFVLESDGDRRKWNARAPLGEGWPVYHAPLEQDSGTLFAAGGSEWHGAGVWRSTDLGETWELSSEGLS